MESRLLPQWAIVDSAFPRINLVEKRNDWLPIRSPRNAATNIVARDAKSTSSAAETQIASSEKCRRKQENEQLSLTTSPTLLNITVPKVTNNNKFNSHCFNPYETHFTAVRYFPLKTGQLFCCPLFAIRSSVSLR